jgi:hypothetical protein
MGVVRELHNRLWHVDLLLGNDHEVSTMQQNGGKEKCI